MTTPGLGQLTLDSSFNDVARAIVGESQRRKHTRDETIAELATGIQESGLRPRAVSPNGAWKGIYQQDAGYPGRDNPSTQISGFFDRLDAKRASKGASADPWLNIFWLQQRPGEPSAAQAYANGRKAYLTEIKSRTVQAVQLYDRYAAADSKPDAQQPQEQEKKVGWQGDPVWLKDVLRDALGERLVVWDGWQDNGTGGQMGDIWGVMIHHTGNRNERPEVIRDGIQQASGWLPGPLSQGLITPDGKFHLVAVGPCNHAGIGSYPGLGTNNGNDRTIGFECAWPTIRADGSYDERERWPDAQIITMRDASAAVIKKLGYDGSRVIGHKTYAGSAQGKWDPGNLDIPWFQGEVNKALRGEFSPKPPVVSPPTPPPPPTLPAPTNPRSDRTLLEEIWDQLRGPGGAGWPQLGGRSLVDALAEVFPQLRTPKAG
jgi:hypothetical protein